MGNLVRRDLRGVFPTLRDDFFAPLQEEFNHFFDDFFDDFFTGSSTLVDRMRSKTDFPKLDAYVQDGKYIVETIVAGVKPEDIDVEVVDNDGLRIVTISGMSQQLPEGTQFTKREIRRSAFARRLVLPEVLSDYEKPEVLLKDGLLRLAWPINQPQLPKDEMRRTKIEVKQLCDDAGTAE